MDNKLFRRVIVACGCTAALTFAAACDNSSSQQRSSSSSAPAAAPADKSVSDNQPVTLTGCLMRGDGRNDFILTKADQPVGTSGASSEPGGSIPERTREAAERSYRLDGDNDQLNALVGHRVRVSGTIKDRGALAASPDTSASSPRGTSGEAGKNKGISESDLAKVDVNSVDSVADSCNGANPDAAKQPAKSKPSRR